MINVGGLYTMGTVEAEIEELAAYHRMTGDQYLKRIMLDFTFCLEEGWRMLGLDMPHWAQLDMAEWMADRHPDNSRRGIEAFRGFSKTWVMALYVPWRAISDKNGSDLKTVIISKSEKHAKDTLHMIRDWIKRIPFFRHLTPSSKHGDRDSSTQLDYRTRTGDTREASISAYGITGQITGVHCHIIIPDDIETPQNSMTIEMRTRLREQATEFEAMLLPGGDIVYLGTPHHEETLYDELIRTGVYEFRKWPARIPKPDMNVSCVSPLLLKKVADGELNAWDPIWPERYSNYELDKLEAAMGRTAFLGQYMLVSGLKDSMKYPLKLADLMVFDCLQNMAPASIIYGTRDGNGSTVIEDIPSCGFGKDKLHRPAMVSNTFEPFQDIAMWVDPSGGGTDLTGYAIGGHLNGMIFAKEVDGLEGGYQPATIAKLVERARHHHVKRIFVEDVALQGMMVQLIQACIKDRYRLEPGKNPKYPQGWNCSVVPVKIPNVPKEIRIIGYLEPVMNTHRLVVDPSVIKSDKLQRQMTRLTRQKNCLGHEDELESLANLCGQFDQVLSVSPEEIERDRYMAEEQARLDAYMGDTGDLDKQTTILRHC